MPRTRRNRGEPVPYDFRRPAKLSRDHVRVLEQAGEAFARRWSSTLATATRSRAQATISAVEQRTYDEWVSELSSPTALATFTTSTLPGTSVLQLETTTCLAYVDRVLGGAAPDTQPERALTEIEQALVLELLVVTLRDFGPAFEALGKVEAHFVELEQNPLFLEAGAATDVVVVITLGVSIGATNRTASMVLPLDAVVARIDSAMSVHTGRPGHNAYGSLLRGHLSGADVEVTARLRGPRMSAADVLALKPGDVLPLGHPCAEPAELIAGDRVVGLAVPGQDGDQLACLVVSANPGQPLIMEGTR